MLKITVFLATLVGVLGLSAFTGPAEQDSPTAWAGTDNAIQLGERIEYRVHYGFINAAEAIVETDGKIHTVNNRPCYRAHIAGRTTGIASWVTKVNDTWQSWIDTSSFLPQQFYMNKNEGNYKTKDRYVFDHQHDVVKTYELDEDQEKQQFKVPNNVQDVVSFCYLMRNMNFNKMKVGDQVSMKAFFDGEVYDISVKYRGQESVKTKFGRIQAIRLAPLLPKTNFFEDEDPLKIWISNDANRIPLRVEVALKIGTLKMDIRKYAGLKQAPKFE
jgi:Protein of unknown function (DUF3108)